MDSLSADQPGMPVECWGRDVWRRRSGPRSVTHLHRDRALRSTTFAAELGGRRKYWARFGLSHRPWRIGSQLEADWEAALAEAARLEADYQQFTEEQPKTLTAEASARRSRPWPLISRASGMPRL
jgi:hypothetical protein